MLCGFHSILLLVAMLITYASKCGAEISIHASFHMGQIHDHAALGDAQIEGIGKVVLHASREGTSVFLHATGPQSKLLARAQTTLGLLVTPIYIPTPKGMEKINIRWNNSSLRK